MGVYFGQWGEVALKRDTLQSALQTKLDPYDVNTSTKRFSVDHSSGSLITGYEVEIDVWYIDKKFVLGHDTPQYEVDWKFLTNSSYWCHAKNIDALNLMLENDIHCFWHQDDDVTITSYGFIWTSPDKKLNKT